MIEDAIKVLLVKPQTFMNLSGRCVRQIVDFYQLPLEDLLIVADDINLPLGKLRARAKGTHGGHNGLRDIQNHLGTTEYARLRIGVGIRTSTTRWTMCSAASGPANGRSSRRRCKRRCRRRTCG